jgi:sarcosine oxidase subunit beta
MPAYDVIIIGGGFLGLSSAYQLSKMGVRTLLLEAGDIGGGTSSSCAGRAQVCEGHLDPLNLQLIRDGLAKHDTLEEELGENYDWRRIGIFLVIKSEGLWNHWKERSAILTPNGIPTEVIDRKALQKAEPNMNTDGLLGAAYSTEGSLNPLKFSHAYARAAQRFGCEIRGNSKVISLEVDNRKVTSVKTKNETYHCEKVAVMTGAWVPTITRLAGVEVPIRHAHAEALITERIPPMVFNNIELADFYETIHGKAKAVAVGVHPNLHGSLDVTEAITRTEELHKRVSAWGLTALSADLLKLFPFLEKVRVVRSWGRPTSFTPDEEPLVGWIPQLDNMYVATSLVETITTVPLLSEWMAMMIQGQVPQVSMDSYSPSRFINGWTWN